jgi:hypothetical protein
MMKSVVFFTAIASLSIPALAQSIAKPAPLTAATAKILNDQDADTAAESDIGRVQPSIETVGKVEIPASQIDALKPASVTPDNDALPPG